MTSKELLQHIENAPVFMGGDIRYKSVTQSGTLYEEDINQIRKDLDVLEILKSKIGISEDIDIRSLDFPLYFLPMTKEERDKIKEWLKNECDRYGNPGCQDHRTRCFR